MMRSILTLYVVVHATLVAGNNPEYCGFKCSHGKDTMCIYDANVPGPACKDFDTSHALTKAQKQQLLDKHNEYRGMVARGEVEGEPAAKEMPALAWSSELEMIAKRWAYQCTYGHDPCRHTKDGVRAGQCVAQSWNTAGYPGDKFMDRFQDMFDEYKDYSPFNAENTLPKTKLDILHYTQMVWAKTLYLGCEQVVYTKDGNHVTAFIVCVYSPPGNTWNTPIYVPLPAGQKGELGPAAAPKEGETGVPGDAPSEASASVGQRSSVLVLTAGVVIAVHSAYITSVM